MKSTTTVLKVLQLASKQFAGQTVQVSGDVTRDDEGNRVFAINLIDSQGEILQADAAHILVGPNHAMQVVNLT